MATIQKRKNQNGSTSYRVMIRTQDGLPATSKNFPTYQEAKDWGIQQEALRRQGLYFLEQSRKKHTLSDLIDRYIEQILSSKPKNGHDTLRHLNWWKMKAGTIALNLVTPDFISKLRKDLLEGLTPKGTKRTPSTKKTNSEGLQFADMVARPVGLSIIRPGQPNQTLKILERKFYQRQDRDGVVLQEPCIYPYKAKGPKEVLEAQTPVG